MYPIRRWFLFPNDPCPNLFLLVGIPPQPPAETAAGVPVAGGKYSAADGSRHNTGSRHEEGIRHITPALREAASRANSVDEALHEFVSAKFCERLRGAGLLDHPLVAEELATYDLLDRR